MESKIIFSESSDINEAKKLLDMGVEIISDKIPTKHRIFYHKDSRFYECFSGTKILKIKDKNDLEFYAKYAIDERLNDYIFLIDCENPYDSFYLRSKIQHKSIFHCDYLTPHIAYMAFSVGFDGILCNDICKNSNGKFVYKLNLAYKKSKNDRFYSKFFNAKKPFTQLRKIKIDRIFGDFSADSIALDLSEPSFATFLYVLKNKNIIKIGIISSEKQFKIARNLQDDGKLDALEVESSDGLDYANFAFYTRFDPNFNMKILG